MNLLLDTHVLLWWLDEPNRLSQLALATLNERENTCYVSAVVVWEIVIKVASGKLEVQGDIDRFLELDRFVPMPVVLAHARVVRSLPSIHRDPFDRMLIAQAKHEGFYLVTRDIQILKYPIATILA